MAIHSAAGGDSKYKRAGTEYDVDVNVTAAVFKNMMIDNVIPAIREKMSDRRLVTVQFDNARAHTGKNVLEEIEQEVNAVGDVPVIKFVLQPANSPDTNPLDLFFFKSLDVIMHKIRSRERAFFNAEQDERVAEDDAADNDTDAGTADADEKARNECGMPSLAKKCVVCKSAEFGIGDNIQCDVRNGWYHVHCLKREWGVDVPDLRLNLRRYGRVRNVSSRRAVGRRADLLLRVWHVARAVIARSVSTRPTESESHRNVRTGLNVGSAVAGFTMSASSSTTIPSQTCTKSMIATMCADTAVSRSRLPRQNTSRRQGCRFTMSSSCGLTVLIQSGLLR